MISSNTLGGGRVTSSNAIGLSPSLTRLACLPRSLLRPPLLHTSRLDAETSRLLFFGTSSPPLYSLLHNFLLHDSSHQALTSSSPLAFTTRLARLHRLEAKRSSQYKLRFLPTTPPLHRWENKQLKIVFWSLFSPWSVGLQITNGKPLCSPLVLSLSRLQEDALALLTTRPDTRHRAVRFSTRPSSPRFIFGTTYALVSWHSCLPCLGHRPLGSTVGLVCARGIHHASRAPSQARGKAQLSGSTQM